MPLNVHLGFDFWGAGNFGDDLMLAGLLHWLRHSKSDIKITALCAHDLHTMQTRFPEIEWYTSDPISRELAVKEADIWIGLGGGIFQLEVGPWMLDQLITNITLAKRRGLPAYLVGVGINNESALSTAQAQLVHSLADQIWLRDEYCMQKAALAGFSSEKTLLGADVAHLAFSEAMPHSHKTGTTFVLHADSNAVNVDAIAYFVDQSNRPTSWFCQEERALPGSEIVIFKQLSERIRQQMTLLRPSYRDSKLNDIINRTASWETTLSSRYHSSLAAAWTGSRLAIYERNDKLRGIRQELEAECCHSLLDGPEMVRALNSAHAIPRSILYKCAARANQMLLNVFGSIHSKTSRHVPLNSDVSTAILDFRDGWYPAESAGQHTWRWSSGTARLAFYVSRSTTLLLGGEWSTLTLPNVVKVTLPDGSEQSWKIIEPGFHPWPAFRFLAPAGLSILSFQTSIAATQPPGDSRHLSLAWRNPAMHAVLTH